MVYSLLYRTTDFQSEAGPVILPVRNMLFSRLIRQYTIVYSIC